MSSRMSGGVDVARPNALFGDPATLVGDGPAYPAVGQHQAQGMGAPPVTAQIYDGEGDPTLGALWRAGRLGLGQCP